MNALDPAQGHGPSTALAVTRTGLADSFEDLFAPVDPAPAVSLLIEYRAARALLERVAGIFADAKTRSCLPYFIDGNEANERYSGEHVAGILFKLDGAIDALNADYWSRLMQSSDILDTMPQKRRTAWHNMISERGTKEPVIPTSRDEDDEDDLEPKTVWVRIPDFTEETIQGTFADLLGSRHTFFAERVDGIFEALSPAHKTNLPSGFRSKLILNYVFDSFGFSSQSRIGTLTDLRVVVARFMGRDDVGEGGHTVRQLTSRLIDYARQYRRGEWVTVDGGAIEVKGHKCGTMHVRIHDEIAWRLNAVLAYLHPGAIPESQCTRPKRGHAKVKHTVQLVTRPLPFAVLQVLDGIERSGQRGNWTFGYGWSDLDKHVRAEVDQVIASIGGIPVHARGPHLGAFKFDYNPGDALREIVASGCVPDTKAHQYYPTPPSLAARMVELAGIGPDDIVLEPSAGQGAIAELLPRGQTTCIEVSALHCTVLRSKGFAVIEDDFLKVSRIKVEPTVVVMNPPFDRAQWEAHVQYAAEMLASLPLDPVWMRDDRGLGSRLVAILPSGAPSRLMLPGFDLTWSEPIEHAFAGSSIVVVILLAVRR
jgi:hypothetical protein